MARKYSLFVYNGTKSDQEWTIFSDGVINQSFKLGQVRKSYTLMLSGDVTIQFGVDDAVYLKATYNYAGDRWTSSTATPNVISFFSAPAAISVSSTYSPD